MTRGMQRRTRDRVFSTVVLVLSLSRKNMPRWMLRCAIAEVRVLSRA